jgi:RHS repeat-associated protein
LIQSILNTRFFRNPESGIRGAYRYGFNGKDRESEFSSGAYDFGARIHDARLGRWMSVDPMVAKYPYESSFVFSGNSSIFFTDIDGMYKFPSETNYKKTYPKFYKYISERIQTDILKSSVIIAALERNTRNDADKDYPNNSGNLQVPEVTELSKFGSGPEIRITPNPGGLSTAAGKYDNGIIYINFELIEMFEHAKTEDEFAALLAVFETILHETVHYGDWLDGIKQDNGIEPGNQFANEVFLNKTVDGQTVESLESSIFQPDYKKGGMDEEATLKKGEEVIAEKSKDSESIKVLPTIN